MDRRLLIRSRKSLTLNEEEIILQERAAEIVALADKTAEEFKSFDEIIGGDIHIGCAESDGFKYFVRILKNLKKYPRDDAICTAVTAIQRRINLTEEF